MGTGNKCAYCRREINDGSICGPCKKEEAFLTPQCHTDDGCLFVVYYDGPVRKLIHDMKYNDMPRNAVYIARKMYECVCEQGVHADIVTYVPVHKSRLRERGFDQSEMIAAHLSYRLKLPMQTLLVRTKETRPQYDLNARERAENMKDAFSLVPASDISGKTILLVDDIYTTGSSMRECAKLIAAQAKVISFAFSRDIRP